MARKRSRSRSRSGGGISRRSLLLLFGVGTAGATGAYTTGAFDSVSGDRSLGVDTAGDDSALLGVDTEDRSGTDGETITLVELTNRFDQPISSINAEIVSASSGPVDPNSLRTPPGLSPGASGTVKADLSCGGDLDGSVEVAITATGPRQSVDLVRSVDVSCTGQDRGVCAPRTPPGCTEPEFPPWGGTDCSVVIDTTGEVSETIGGGIEVGGAVDVRTDGEVEVTHRGSVADYFGIDTDGEIGFSMGGGATVGGPLQLSTPGEVTAEIGGGIDGGFCADEAGALDVTVGRGGSVGGPMSLSSTGEMAVELTGNASVGPLSAATSGEIDVSVSDGSEIDGTLDIETSGEVGLALDGNERIRGDVTIATEDAVDIELDGSSTIEGDVTIDAPGEVGIELGGRSSIAGDVTVTSDGEVGIELGGSSSIGGGVAVTSDGEVGIELGGRSSVGDDVSIDTAGEASVSDCAAVNGSVTPQSACDG